EKVASALVNKGVSLGQLGRSEEEVAAYDAALAIVHDMPAARLNRGIALFNSHQYAESLRETELSRRVFLESKATENASLALAFQLWAAGMQNWAEKQYSQAQDSMHNASLAFRDCGRHAAAQSLELLSDLMPLDDEFMCALGSHSLSELRRRCRPLATKMRKLLKRCQGTIFREEILGLLESKITCLSSLVKSLGFRADVDFAKLNVAKECFRSHGLVESVKAVNHLENFILDLRKYSSIKDIPNEAQRRLLLALLPVEALNGYVSARISAAAPREPLRVSPEKTSEQGAPRRHVELVHIDDTAVNSVRLCLAQLDFGVSPLPPVEGFGYRLADGCQEIMRRKVFSVLRLARNCETDIVCFPELSFLPQWVDDVASEFPDMITVAGSYYRDSFNTCAIVIGGEPRYVNKILPSPHHETTLGERGMKPGSGVIEVFETKYGRLAILICRDFKELTGWLLQELPTKSGGLDFVFSPCYNTDWRAYQESASTDCQLDGHPYVVLVNALDVDEKPAGGSCVVAMENDNAVSRYKTEGWRSRDGTRYTCIEAKGEMAVVADVRIGPAIIHPAG
ncbi:MAG: hypothetical protein NTU41_11870, partial [Chloroflexi bacterium]|nr:hypothetical protein [Chloroflexota bacterium]